MKEPESISPAKSVPTITCYISAVGAAFIATFFDYVRNRDLSALKKTAITIREIFELSAASTSSQSVFAILIFCAIAAVLVCAYQPKETKESFLLGLSVLVVAGLSVPPLQPTNAEAKNTRASGGASALDVLPISTAYAEDAQISREERMVWIVLDGPGQRQIPETKVMAYSGTSGRLLINSLVFTKFYLILPAGVHQIEISRFGYRSVSFRISPAQAITAYKIPMSETQFDSLKNFLGPQSISVEEDPKLTELLGNSVNECRLQHSETAASYAKQAGIQGNKLERDARRLLCL